MDEAEKKLRSRIASDVGDYQIACRNGDVCDYEYSSREVRDALGTAIGIILSGKWDPEDDE